MSWRCPSRTSRFAGLMSRCASPESQSLRISASPSSMISSLTSASPISRRAVEELGQQQVLARRRELDDPVRLRGGDARSRASPAACSPRTPRAGRPTGTALRPRAGRRGACARACTSGRRARGSSRRASRRGRCRVAGDADAQRRGTARPGETERLDLDDGQAELVLDGVADGLAAAPADVEVRGLALAVGDGEDLVGGEEAERVDEEARR